MLFFQLINRRYERASTVLTSNKGFEEWGQILGDEVMAAALIDRLLHHCHIVNIRGSSENTNGLIRQYLPKRTSMAHITQHACNRIAHKLNNRPRKRLGFLTPKDCYELNSTT